MFEINESAGLQELDDESLLIYHEQIGVVHIELDLNGNYVFSFRPMLDLFIVNVLEEVFILQVHLYDTLVTLSVVHVQETSNTGGN